MFFCAQYLLKAAETRYQQEVVAHAQLREQVSTLQTSSRENSIAAETAIAKLAASEQSWAQQKDILEKEITEQTNR